MDWLTLHKQSMRQAYKGLNASAIHGLREAIAHLDASKPNCRETAGRLRSDLAWVLVNDQKYDQALFVSKRSMAALKGLRSSSEAYGWAANSAAVAAWHVRGPAACAMFAKMGLDYVSVHCDGQKRLAALLRGNLGLSLHTIGRVDEAIIELRAALDYFVSSNDTDSAMTHRRRLANAYQDAGYLKLSTDLMQLCRPSDNETPEVRVAWLNALALLYERQDKLLEAAEAYDSAVALFSDLKRPVTEFSAVVSNAALLDIELGRIQTAYERAQQLNSLDWCGPAPLHSRIGNFRIRAELALTEKDHERALNIWLEAANLLKRDAGNDPAQLSKIFTNIARLQIWLGREDQAQELLEAFLSEFPLELPVMSVPPALVLAKLLREQHDLVGATQLAQRALISELGRREPENLWRSYHELSEVMFASGARDKAIFLGKCAVDQIHKTSRLLEVDRTALESYLDDRLIAHRSLIDKLAVSGRLPEAIHVQRMIKIELHNVLVNRDRSHSPSFQPLPKSALEHATYSKVDQHSQKVVEARDISVDWRLKPAQRLAAKQVLTQEKVSIRTLLHDFPEEDIRSVRQNKVQDVSSQGEELVIRFLAGQSRVAALLSTNSGLTEDVTLSVTTSELGKAVLELLTAIERMQSVEEPAKWLYDTLLSPFSSYLANTRELDIVCDGPLAYLPFACLRGPDSFLIESHSLAVRTGITIRREQKIPSQAWRSAAFVNDFSTGTELPPLLFTRREGEALKRHAPSVDCFTNSDFTQAALFSAFSKYEHIHLATHFELAPASNHRSKLYTGSNQSVDLASLRNAVNDMKSVELLVLSCCDSGSLDQSDVGLESLATLAHAAGAGQVVGTLWPVSDESTADLMDIFYERLFSQASAASTRVALQEAQLSLLYGRSRSHGTSLDTRGLGEPATRSPNWNHPFHWAGFVNFVNGG